VPGAAGYPQPPPDLAAATPGPWPDHRAGPAAGPQLSRSLTPAPTRGSAWAGAGRCGPPASAHGTVLRPGRPRSAGADRRPGPPTLPDDHDQRKCRRSGERRHE